MKEKKMPICHHCGMPTIMKTRQRNSIASTSKRGFFTTYTVICENRECVFSGNESWYKLSEKDAIAAWGPCYRERNMPKAERAKSP